ncbi:hypothetical protein M426DRAFT_316068 [Hypoxylon sp. CI-4A]|nr:hypothetical protein M426DRAFT_316068 [Hypoxylon sp. CI-4A]
MQFLPKHLTTYLVTILLSVTNLAHSYDATPFIGPLDPWQVSSLQVTTTATTSDATTISLAIRNPNTVSAGPAPFAAGGGYLPFNPSAANCSLAGSSEACIETTEFSYGVWTVDVAPGFDPRSFDAKFSLDYNVTRWNSVWYKVYKGTGHFEVGINLDEAVCEDGDEKKNTCVYGLGAAQTPVLVTPTMTECKGTCSLPSSA